MSVKSGTKQKNADKKSTGRFSWNERAFQELAENFSDGVYFINADGYFRYVNRVLSERSGIPLEQYPHLHFLDVIDPDHHELAKKNFQNVLKGKDGIPYELKFKDTKGRVRVVEVHSRPVRHGRKIIGICGISREITERKWAEKRINDVLGFNRSILSASPIAILVYNSSGQCVSANEAASKILGGTIEELLTQNFRQLDAWKGAGMIEVAENALMTREIQFLVTSGYTTFGKNIWRDCRFVPFYYEDEVHLLVLVSDITELKQTEEALQEAHRRLDEIIEFLPDATFVIEADGKVIAWNKAIEQMTGVSKAEMIGKGEYEYAFPFYGERRPLLIDLALLEDPEFEKRKYDITRRAADTIYAEAYVPKTYGGKGAYLSGSASRLRDSAGNIVGAIESIRDATQRKRAENELAKYRKGLEQLVAERTKGLEDKTKALEELNISLKVLLRHREEDKKELEDRFMSNVKRLILPYVEKMKSGALDPYQKSRLGIIESNLNDIISPFVRRMRDYNFTPKELTVASLIKDGRTTKEIAEILGVGTHAIDSHRNRIRKKTGLTARKSNLQSHLRSLE